MSDRSPTSGETDPRDRPRRLAAFVALWIGLGLLVGVALYVDYSSALPQLDPPERPAAGGGSASEPATVADETARETAAGDETASDDRPEAGPTRIENVTIRDRDGRVEFRGTVDLAPTLARIEHGDRLRFSHDGIKFQNREGRLPRKPSGYYHEFVHPTPGVSGPGGQRVIVGRSGEVYYSFDHYRTFRRIR